MIIRDAIPADLPAIESLQLASWRNTYGGLVPDGYLDAQVALDLAAHWKALPDAPDFVLLAIEDDRLVGFITLLTESKTPPYVDNLHVLPGAKGRGLGRFLMAAAARRLLADGFEAMWLTVLEGNAGSRAFYARMGGQEGAPFGEEMLGQPVRAVRLDWTDLRALATAAPVVPDQVRQPLWAGKVAEGEKA